MRDRLTIEQRSRCMASVRNKNTDIELLVRSGVHKRGLRFRKHPKQLPGTPDIVFWSARVAVFIDGDFWHGFAFQKWEHTLHEYWKKKIATNRMRDQRNFRKLRRMGWKVVRIWQHEIERDLISCVDRVESAVNMSLRHRTLTNSQSRSNR
jgi:DNA mismatch endonuclease (patch repair protein)